MGNTHGRGKSHAPAEMMGRLPLFLRTGWMRRSPVEPAGRRLRGNSNGGVGGASGADSQQEHGLLADGSTCTSEPNSLPLPPPPPPPRRRRAATFLRLVVLAAAVAAVWSSRSNSLPLAGRDSSSSDGSLSKLPFLGGEDGVGQGRIDASRWVRVRSPSAMHPAMYVPGDGMVYCPIAKVACAEWRKTLRWMLGIPDWDTGPIHDQGKNGIPLLALKKVKEVELIMNDDSWLKFVVVRDPADRLLSAFLNKCVGGEWQNCPYMEFMPHRFQGVKARSPATDAKFKVAINDEPRKVFRDFMLGVRKDVRLRGCKVNSHWRPQHCFCSISRFRESYRVIPFANMSTEAVKLVDHMQRPSPARADLLRDFMVSRFSSNKDAKAQGATTKREKYFSREALAVVTTVYEKDYSLFGEYFEEHSAPPLQ